MQTVLAVLQIVSFALSFFLAGYALSRSRFHPLMITLSLGLVSYALIQMDSYTGERYEREWLARLLWAAYPLPAAFLARVVILLKQNNTAWDRVWWSFVLPPAVLLILGGWVGEDLVEFSTRERGVLYPAYGAYNLIVALFASMLAHIIYRQTPPRDRMKPVFYWLRLGGLGYAASMLILLSGVLSADWVFTLVLIDILIFSLMGILYEALSEGQRIRGDLALAFLKTLLIGTIVILPWNLATLDRPTFANTLAFFVSLSAVAFLGTLVDDLEILLDRLVLRSERGRQRQALRTLLLNTARQSDENPLDLDPEEFTRLTRRALSHMPDLPRLAASPLTQMQIVNRRLDEDANQLERANELRQILAECIESLRPADRGEYGITDEWRFFNALYYPYVAGISPYKRSLLKEQFDETTQTVIEWFRTSVPPRTLYNWQNRAAAMIADILRQQEQQRT